MIGLGIYTTTTNVVKLSRYAYFKTIDQVLVFYRINSMRAQVPYPSVLEMHTEKTTS